MFRLNPYEKLDEVASYVIGYQYLIKSKGDVMKIPLVYREILGNISSDVLFKLIVTKVEPYIRNYPQIAFRKTNADLKSEFFIYIYERFENILEKYDPTIGKFSTYFSIKLKNYFLNYIRREKVMNKVKHINYEIIPSTENIFKDDYDLELDVAEREVYVGEKEREDLLLENLKKDPFRYLCVKLYFFELFTQNDFEFLIRYLKLDTNRSAQEDVKGHIFTLSEEIHKKKLVKMYYENCLNKTYYQNMLRQEETSFKTSEYNPQAVQESIEKENRISERKSTLLQKYYSINIFPSMKCIAKVLQTNSTKVSNVINYYKQHLDKKDFRNRR